MVDQFMTTAFLHRRISIIDLLKNWVISFFGNLAGMLFFMAIITGCMNLASICGINYLTPSIDGGVFQMAVYKTETINFATMKVVDPGWHQIFLRAIGGERPNYYSIASFAKKIHSKLACLFCGVHLYFVP